MKTWKILITGRVQKVGYRRLVDEIAYRLGVNGSVKNLEDKRTVEVIAQHENEEMLRRFTEFIKINEYPIKAEALESCEIESQTYTDFQVIEGPLELENKESLEAGAIYLRKLASGMDKLNIEMRKTREELGNKIDGGSAENKKGFESLGEKIDNGFDKIGKKIDTGFENTGKRIDEGFGGTNKRFDTLDKKYGTVSKNLEEISKDLKEINGNLRPFKPKE